MDFIQVGRNTLPIFLFFRLLSNKQKRGDNNMTMTDTYKTVLYCENCDKTVEYSVPKGMDKADFRDANNCGYCGCSLN